MSKSLTIKTILAELVSMPTVTSDQAANHEALDYIEEFLTACGMYCTRFAVDGSGSLVATTRPTKTPKIMLAGHVDVVPGSGDLFAMRQQGDKIMGRGVFDMKSAIASYLMAAHELKDNLSDYDFGIMITSDEETVDLGVKHLLREGYCPKEAAVLFDGARDWQLEKQAKGALYLNLSIADKTGHGSRPWLVDSSSMRMVKLLAEIEKLFPQPGPETSTLNINSLVAGELNVAYNQIPAVTHAGLDIRSIDEAERTRVGKAVKSLCKEFGATYEILAEFPPIAHDMGDPHMRAFAASIEKITGVKAAGVTSYGASDAAHFLARGISCIVTWPFGGGHHSEGEWINAKALHDITPVILDYLNNTTRTTTHELVGTTAVVR